MAAWCRGAHGSSDVAGGEIDVKVNQANLCLTKSVCNEESALGVCSGEGEEMTQDFSYQLTASTLGCIHCYTGVIPACTHQGSGTCENQHKG